MKKSLLVLCNFKDYEASYSIPEGLDTMSATLLIGNYEQLPIEEISVKPLRPFECRVYHLN